ncbi:hypothetical protein NDU88_007962 [Pleurodeles waltl]|uniref:Uncharacterized protein n=1 Tax=Pleurodeles waltl TaxID=8319 RepID=A0AAV7NXZ5_PLEWA|nr:hypothetical protein NDU88_007962 [Pleurodeles waltl]
MDRVLALMQRALMSLAQKEADGNQEHMNPEGHSHHIAQAYILHCPVGSRGRHYKYITTRETRTSQFTIGHMAPTSVWVIRHSFVRRARPFFNLYRSRAQDAGLRVSLDSERGSVALMVFASSSRREVWLVGKPTRPVGRKESCLGTKQVDNLGIKNTSAGELKTVSEAFWLKPGWWCCGCRKGARDNRYHECP